MAKKRGIIIDDSQDHKVRYGRGTKPPAPPKPVDYSAVEDGNGKRKDSHKHD